VKENGSADPAACTATTGSSRRMRKGWGKKALAETPPRPTSASSPDRPPTQLYDSYTATFVAPFHYRNPVTGK